MVKWKSRKFLAFIVWAGIVIYSIIKGVDSTSAVPMIIHDFSFITMIYMGGQAAIDFIKEKSGGLNP